MKRVDVAEAGNQLRALLVEAHDGEEVLLTDAGRIVGRLVAEGPASPKDVEAIMSEVQAIHDDMAAKGAEPFSTDEIRSLINEGRRY